MNKFSVIELELIGDKRGSLISLEGNKNIPFDIKRIYYIFNTKKGVKRGFHAHINLKQIAIAVKGSCTFVLDDGNKREELTLNNPNQGLFIEGLIWREMKDFSEDCVLIVLANEHYNEKDYIRSYDKFLEVVKNEKN
ncbi:dTDP-6-deoxy-3,4-keto-hexulose isomerase [Arcobacter cryaerophilus gv. occultus]|uniref:sugar 3,4-ketoisomerase n=1 Tax=Aliarcobacter cryaerophilus TaxID=28198 RepID=UPI000D016C30|nr:FdtA/QdtA family cupin domain-containing protein [Aliarcobacter cryaerophilus]PRM91331.1 dTDP-6-deoxy-3,4-keto-hexulose isomerase [Arcobacter cryaerophilus gv. occultus]